jgi:recombinational DNA repair protein (RecF pathway)
MSYTIYSTLGFVCRTLERGEAGRFVTIFTRELGLIHVIAEGTRLIHSKMKPYVQAYQWGRFDVVLGKRGWRLVGAHQLESNYHSDQVHLAIWSGVADLLLQLEPDQAHEEIFSDIETLAFALRQQKIAQDLALQWFTVRYLYHLGYWPGQYQAERVAQCEQLPATSDWLPGVLIPTVVNQVLPLIQ